MVDLFEIDSTFLDIEVVLANLPRGITVNNHGHKASSKGTKIVKGLPVLVNHTPQSCCWQGWRCECAPQGRVAVKRLLCFLYYAVLQFLLLINICSTKKTPLNIDTCKCPALNCLKCYLWNFSGICVVPCSVRLVYLDLTNSFSSVFVYTYVWQYRLMHKGDC